VLTMSGPSERRGRLGASAKIGRAVLPVALSTGLTGAAALGLSFAVRLNVSPSAPIGFYRSIDRPLERNRLVVACVPPWVAPLAWERGYLGRGSCPGHVQPVLKRLTGLPGDVVEVGQEAVTVNGVRVADSATAAHDSRGRPLPHAPWGRIVLGPGEVWLLGTDAARSWDSRYFGAVSLDHVQAVSPVLTTRRGP
jgi:conjugative transfer signal peptidase TraF